MSHSFFSSRERDAQRKRDTSPLLPFHEPSSSVRLQNLSPRPSVSGSSRRASPSPPASFYRDNNAARIGLGHGNGDGSRSPISRNSGYRDRESYDGEERRGFGSLSLSPERKRRIQFAAPPPPLVGGPGMGSSFLSPKNTTLETGRPRSQGSISTSRERSSLVSTRDGGGGAVDPLLVLERRERALQMDLQTLLDAQSLGLIKGLGATGSEIDGNSEGSSTPTGTGSRSGRSGGGGGIIPVRQPKRKTITLRGARRGVGRVMNELAGMKSEEVHTLVYEVGRREQALSRIHVWEERMEGVRKQLENKSSTGTVGDDLADLQKESRNLGTQIRDLEDKLLQLRARQRWVEERITAGVNKREARLSSYRGALKEVEKEVKEFLKRPPIQTTTAVLPELMEEQSFLTLKPERRTLGMAREWWEREVSALQTRKEEVEFEKAALEEGGVLWKECITAINGFENELRKEMAGNSADGTEGLRRQIAKMDEVMTLLKDKLGTCEDKGWKLLLVAVGAELEAFKEGKRMLLAVLGELEPASQPPSNQDLFANGDGEHAEHNERASGHALNGNGLHVLGGEEGTSTREASFQTAPEPHPEPEVQETESEDEEPNLDELLVDSRHKRSDSS